MVATYDRETHHQSPERGHGIYLKGLPYTHLTFVNFSLGSIREDNAFKITLAMWDVLSFDILHCGLHFLRHDRESTVSRLKDRSCRDFWRTISNGRMGASIIIPCINGLYGRFRACGVKSSPGHLPRLNHEFISSFHLCKY